MKTFNPKFLIAIIFIILAFTGAEIFAGIGENSNTNKENICFINKISKNSFSEKKFNSICYGKVQFFKKKKAIKDNSLVKIRLVKTDSPKIKNIIEVNNGSYFILEAVPGKYQIKDIFFNGKYYKIGKTFELLKDYLTDLGIIKVKLFEESLKEYSYNIEIISRLNKYIFTRDEKLRTFINAVYPPGPQGTSDIKLFIPNWNNSPKASFYDSKTLFKAAENGDISSLRSFVKEKFDINIQDDKGWTPFMFALFNHKKEIAELLLKEGVNVNLKTKNNWTVLMFALRYKQPEIARLLIEKGAKINTKTTDGITPLMLALQYDQPQNARLLISRGAEINVTNQIGWTPLMLALRYNQPENAKLLIEKGADVNISIKAGWTPLLFAVNFKQPENAKLLIEKGADVNVKNSNGDSPLSLARKNDYREIVLLIDKSPKPQIEKEQPWPIKRGFPIPANTININSGKCGALSQSCFADLEVNSTKKQAFDFLKTQLQKKGWIIDQAFHANNESSSLKKPEIWGIINVNKDLCTLTYIIPSDKAKKYSKTHVILTFFNRGGADKIADFVKKIPKIMVLKNDINKNFKYKQWAVKVLSATKAGNLIKKTKYFIMRPYTFRNNNPNTYLLRVKIQLERLDGKPIKKTFMTDVKVRDTAGNVYDWIGAGSENGEYYDRRRKGVQSLLIPMQPKSDDVEYVFSIPNNVLICEFVWQNETPIGITVK